MSPTNQVYPIIREPEKLSLGREAKTGQTVGIDPDGVVLVVGRRGRNRVVEMGSIEFSFLRAAAGIGMTQAYVGMPLAAYCEGFMGQRREMESALKALRDAAPSLEI